MCIEIYSKDNILDPNKRLCDVGITTAGQYKLIYDFAPVSYPLLTTALPEAQEVIWTSVKITKNTLD